MIDRFLSIPNFASYQHYKHRNPPWIKLYSSILGDYDFHRLSNSERYQLIGMWLLASRSNNKIPYDIEYIKHQILSTEEVNIDKLLRLGWLLVVDEEGNDVTDDSDLLAPNASGALAACNSIGISYSNVLSRVEKRREEKSREEKNTCSSDDERDHRFGRFWDRYPRKTGKPSAQKAFNKAVKSEEDLDKILFSIDQRLEVGEWDAVNRKQFIPHPATWLNRHGWEDDVIPPATTESRQQSVSQHNDRIISQYMSNGGELWIESN